MPKYKAYRLNKRMTRGADGQLILNLEWFKDVPGEDDEFMQADLYDQQPTGVIQRDHLTVARVDEIIARAAAQHNGPFEEEDEDPLVPEYIRREHQPEGRGRARDIQEVKQRNEQRKHAGQAGNSQEG